MRRTMLRIALLRLPFLGLIGVITVACGGRATSTPTAGSGTAGSGGTSAGPPSTGGVVNAAGMGGSPATGDAGTDACDAPSACNVDVIVEQTRNPRKLLVDGGYIYWDSDFGSQLWRIAESVGSQQLVEANAAPWFGADADAAYVLTTHGFKSHRLTRRFTAGGAQSSLAEFDYQTFAPSNASFLLDATHIYFSHYSFPTGENGLFRVSKSGGVVETVAAAPDQAGAFPLSQELVALDETHAYLLEEAYGQPPSLIRIEKSGGDASLVAQPLSATSHEAQNFMLDDDFIYWTQHRTGKVDDPWGRVVRAPKQGGPVQVVVSEQEVDIEYWLHGGQIFWRTFQDEIFRSSKTGAGSEHLFKQPGRWLAVAHGQAYFAVRHSNAQYEENYRLVRRALCECDDSQP